MDVGFLRRFREALQHAHAAAESAADTGHAPAPRWPRLDDMTTQQCCELFVKPACAGDDCAFINCAAIPWVREHQPGKTASVFCSHAWSYRIMDVLNALIAYANEQPGTVFWFDLVVNNQVSSGCLPQEWWSSLFKQTVRSIGKTLVIMSPWDKPVPLSRAWCLWEIGMTLEANAALEIRLDDKQERAFKDAILQDADALHRTLSELDARHATASKASDVDMIFKVIRSTFGFDRLNRLVKERMREWALKTAKCLVQSTAKHDDIELLHVSSFLMCTLGGNPGEGIKLAQEALSLSSQLNCPVRRRTALYKSHRVLGRAFRAAVHQHVRMPGGDPRYSAISCFRTAKRLQEQAAQGAAGAAEMSPKAEGEVMVEEGGVGQGQKHHRQEAQAQAQAQTQTQTQTEEAEAEEQLELAETLNDLGNALTRVRQLDEARVLLTKAFDLRKALLPPLHKARLRACQMRLLYVTKKASQPEHT